MDPDTFSGILPLQIVNFLGTETIGIGHFELANLMILGTKPAITRSTKILTALAMFVSGPAPI